MTDVLTLKDGTKLDRDEVLVAVALERIDLAFDRGFLKGDRPEINSASVGAICDAAWEAGVEFSDAEIEDVVRHLVWGLRDDQG